MPSSCGSFITQRPSKKIKKHRQQNKHIEIERRQFVCEPPLSSCFISNLFTLQKTLFLSYLALYFFLCSMLLMEVNFPTTFSSSFALSSKLSSFSPFLTYPESFAWQARLFIHSLQTFPDTFFCHSLLISPQKSNFRKSPHSLNLCNLSSKGFCLSQIRMVQWKKMER